MGVVVVGWGRKGTMLRAGVGRVWEKQCLHDSYKVKEQTEKENKDSNSVSQERNEKI